MTTVQPLNAPRLDEDPGVPAWMVLVGALVGGALVAAVMTLTPLTVAPTPDDPSASWVDLRDGRVVPCVIYAGARAGGIDCNWATAAREGEG